MEMQIYIFYSLFDIITNINIFKNALLKKISNFKCSNNYFITTFFNSAKSYFMIMGDFNLMGILKHTVCIYFFDDLWFGAREPETLTITIFMSHDHVI